MSAVIELTSSLKGEVLTDAQSCFDASYDNARLSFLPDAVVRPASDDDIATALKLANQHGIPIIPRGTGSATTGAASPIRGGWVIDLSGWTGIEIDSLASMAKVEAGAVIFEIQKAAGQQGLFYPPDPSSHKFATIGGTIATNAGGLRGAKYGVTRDYIFALEGFLPNGEPFRWGGELRKYVSGYNMRDLLIGSEGTLGIVTRAVLKLISEPTNRWTGLALFHHENDALDVVREICKQRINPAILEFLDRQTVAVAEIRQGKPMLKGVNGPAALLIELDGNPDEIEKGLGKLKSILEGAISWKGATDDDECEALWHLRRTCSQAMFQHGDTKLNEDVVVPIRAQKELLRYTLEIKDKMGLATPTFGHAADGNFHVHVMFNREDSNQRKRAEESLDLLMRKVVALGGTITGEHGIGLTKSPFLSLQHSEAEIEAMKSVKQALDPNGIMNPGKIFEPFNVWECETVKVKRPWDHH